MHLFKEKNSAENRLYRSLFENSHSIMMVIHPQDGRILDVNKKACSYYGYPKKILVQMRITEINTLKWDEVFEEMERARRELRDHFNFRHRLKNGQIRDVEVFSNPICFNGEEVLYSIIHDVTEERERKRRLARLNRERENFLHIIGHDLKNPLGNILSFLEMLDLQPEMLEEAKSYIRTSAEHSLSIVEQVRLLKVLEDGKEKIQLEVCCLKELIERAGLILQPQLQKKNIKLRVQIPPEVLLRVDPVLFVTSVLNNLLSNAIKFSIAGGQIAISVRQQNKRIQLTIADCGMGIPQNILEHIFEIRKSASRPGTENEIGTGFGMPILKQIIAPYGGTIAIQSRAIEQYPVFHGTRIILSFPAIESK